MAEDFDDWLRSERYPKDFDAQPTAWQETQTLLCALETKYRLRAYAGVGTLLNA